MASPVAVTGIQARTETPSSPAPQAVLSPAEILEQMPVMGAITLVWICTLLAMITYLTLTRSYDKIERERSESVIGAMRQAEALVRTRDAIIFGLAQLADSRDHDTGDHLERIAAYSTTLASAMRRHPRYRHHISSTFIKLDFENR